MLVLTLLSFSSSLFAISSKAWLIFNFVLSSSFHKSCSLIFVTDVLVGICSNPSNLYFQESICFILSSSLDSIFVFLAISSILLTIFSSSISSCFISFIKVFFLIISIEKFSFVFFAPSFTYISSNQSKYVLYFSIIYESIFSSLYPSNNFCFWDILLFASFCLPTIISFSFGLVSATYRTLISSETASFLAFIARAFFASVLYSICFSEFIYWGPNPKSWSSSIFSFKSLKLNCFPVPASITTGNSNPLLLWIVIILTTSSFSPIIFADFKSSLLKFILSMKLMKLYNPLKLADSYCFALSNSIFKFEILRFPFGIKLT